MKKTLAFCCVIVGASLVGYGVLADKQRRDAAAKTAEKLKSEAFHLTEILIRFRGIRVDRVDRDVSSSAAESLAKDLRNVGGDLKSLLLRIGYDRPGEELRSIAQTFEATCYIHQTRLSEALESRDGASIDSNYAVAAEIVQEKQEQARDYLTLLAAKAR